MRCEYQARNIDRLLAHASGGAGAAEGIDLLMHVENCPECARLVSEQTAVWHSLETWDAPEVSLKFDAGLWGRLRQPEALRATWRERFQNWLMWNARPALPIAAACTVALAATLSVPWFTHSRSAIRAEKVDIEQVEKTVDDMDLLRTLTPVASVTTQKRNASL